MAKISWFKALCLAGAVADVLTTASADGKITVDEALSMAKDLAGKAGLVADSDGFAFTTEVLTGIVNAVADGKVTIREIIDLTEALCTKLGIEFDKEGIQV